MAFYLFQLIQFLLVCIIFTLTRCACVRGGRGCANRATGHVNAPARKYCLCAHSAHGWPERRILFETKWTLVPQRSSDNKPRRGLFSLRRCSDPFKRVALRQQKWVRDKWANIPETPYWTTGFRVRAGSAAGLQPWRSFAASVSWHGIDSRRIKEPWVSCFSVSVHFVL